MADVRDGSGSAFRGWVGFGDQTFGDIPLRFRGFRDPNTSLGNPPETIEDGDNLTTTTSADIETTTINEGAAPEVSDDSSFENELNQNKTTNTTEKPKICNQTVVFGILLTVQVYTYSIFI